MIYIRNLILLCLFGFFSLITTQDAYATKAPSKKGSIVQIETDYGIIKIKLYDDTPLHRDNFLKLVKDGYYDATLFHRVINEFMIQGGDPDSKNAPEGIQLGNGGPDYTIPAEFVSKYYHKKGALAAARQGDDMNPEKRSSGSQFYIVHGRVFSPDELNAFATRQDQQIKFTYIRDFLQKPENLIYKNRVDSLQSLRDNDGINKIVDEIALKEKDALSKLMKPMFSSEQIEIYSTIGGSPHLDGAYTVFGEVIEGFDVIDKIAALEVDKNNRPLKNVAMQVTVIK